MDLHKDSNMPAKDRASLDDKVNRLTEQESKKKLAPASTTAAAPQNPLIDNDEPRQKVSDAPENFQEDEFETTVSGGFTSSSDWGTDGVRFTNTDSCGSGGGSCKVRKLDTR